MQIKYERLRYILEKVYVKDELVTKPIHFEWWRPIQSCLEKSLYSFLSNDTSLIVAYRRHWNLDESRVDYEVLLDKIGIQKKPDSSLEMFNLIVFQKIKMVGNKFESSLLNVTIK